jgi:hypothetical protein
MNLSLLLRLVLLQKLKVLQQDFLGPLISHIRQTFIAVPILLHFEEGFSSGLST